MRSLWISGMLLSALLGCKAPEAVGADAGPAPGATSAPAAPSSAPSASVAAVASSAPVVGRAEPVPGQYGRFYCDGRRFSASFPETPSRKTLATPGFTAVEVETVSNRIGYAAICGPVSGHAFENAHQKAVGDGKLLSETHPGFHGTDAYQIRVATKGGGERLMLLVKYGERFCSVGVEMDNAGDEQLGYKFLGSFRPEPAP